MKKFSIFEKMEELGSEQVIFNYDEASGLKCIISIHDTTVGPALGGCRMWDYDTEEEAVIDSIRLAEGMTKKCSVSRTSNGGGKAVIMGDPETDKTETLFRALGRFLQTLNGRYYSGTDVGTTGEDFVHASQESDFLVGLPEEYGGSGDTAIPTAYGVFSGIQATVEAAYDKDSLEGLTIAVQGAGKVGSGTIRHLIDAGANIIVADVVDASVNKLKDEFPQIEVVDPDDIHKQECHVFVPCALGAGINDETINEFKCKAIAGSANNQLAEPKHGQILHDKGILWAPDFVINSGGLLQVADELEMGSSDHDRLMSKVETIRDILSDIYEESEEKNIPTMEAADRLSQDRLDTIGAQKNIYVTNEK